jgi:hypothetical protein
MATASVATTISIDMIASELHGDGKRRHYDTICDGRYRQPSIVVATLAVAMPCYKPHYDFLPSTIAPRMATTINRLVTSKGKAKP